MSGLYPHNVDYVKSTIGCLHASNGFGKLRPMTEDPYPYKEIGERLEALRRGFSDLDQKGWAEKHGFNKTQYNNWAKGSRRIPVESAEHLCDRYNLTLDAIYRGRVAGLSDTLLKIL